MTFRPLRRDPDAPHQIHLDFASGINRVQVNCNCRVRKGLRPVAIANSAAEAGKLYNDAANHVEPFTVNDRLYRLEGTR